MNVSQKTDRMGGEISAWFAANGADLVFAVLAGLFVMALLWALRAFGHRLVRDRSEDQKWRNLVGRMLAKTGSLFIILCGLEIVAELTRLPRTADRAVDILFTIAAVLQGAIWARALVLGLLTHRISEAEQTSTFGSAFGLIRGLVSIALFLVALVLILDNLGVNVTGLIAGLGIGGIAIGLAAQGIFKDLFAAIAIILDKPFRRGETIKFDAFTGTVEQIGLKSTRLRSVEGEEIVISNAILLDKVMLNFAAIPAAPYPAQIRADLPDRPCGYSRAERAGPQGGGTPCAPSLRPRRADRRRPARDRLRGGTALRKRRFRPLLPHPRRAHRRIAHGPERGGAAACLPQPDQLHRRARRPPRAALG
jgi:small-conductance mechanosensitive channel